jgi:hypothetical protein
MGEYIEDRSAVRKTVVNPSMSTAEL